VPTPSCESLSIFFTSSELVDRVLDRIDDTGARRRPGSEPGNTAMICDLRKREHGSSERGIAVPARDAQRDRETEREQRELPGLTANAQGRIEISSVSLGHDDHGLAVRDPGPGPR